MVWSIYWMIKGQEFQTAAPIIDTLNNAGYEAYFVGGAVRDLLLDLPIHDVDIATSAYPAEVQALFPKHFDVGLEHGTIMVWHEGETYEITTFRTESTYQDYRRPDKVTFVQNLEEDLLRRDFTINALAMKQDFNIIDYFDGQSDLHAKIIRAVGQAKDRFQEDGLRMMRAVRFASQLDFTIEPSTLLAISENAPILVHIAVERIAVEMNKLWLGKNWQKGVDYFLSSDLYRFVPVLDEYPNAFKHLLENTSCQVRFDHAEIAWSLVFFNHFVLTDMPSTEAIIQDLRNFGKAWKMSNQAIKDMVDYLNIWHYRLRHDKWTKQDLYGKSIDKIIEVELFIQDQQKAGERLFESTFTKADPEAIQEIYGQLTIHSLRDLAVNGKIIIEKVNPENKREIGQMLHFLEQAVVDDRVENNQKALLDYLKVNYSN